MDGTATGLNQGSALHLQTSPSKSPDFGSGPFAKMCWGHSALPNWDLTVTINRPNWAKRAGRGIRPIACVDGSSTAEINAILDDITVYGEKK